MRQNRLYAYIRLSLRWRTPSQRDKSLSASLLCSAEALKTDRTMRFQPHDLRQWGSEFLAFLQTIYPQKH
jgi:hypothetical protein